MRVLYFGTYERDYPRNARVISCLRQAGVEVIERHVDVWAGREHKLGLGPLTGVRLALAELRLLRRSRIDFDVVLVGYPGHLDLAAAQRVAGDRPVVFNPLVSLEDTLVEDRGLLQASSLRARVVRAVDRKAFRAADLVVADTAAHAQFFRTRFGLAGDRVAVCLVGAEDAVFAPDPRVLRGSEVLFVGKLIPLHGLETILAAATLCPEIPFRLVGSGQLDDRLRRLPTNVRHESWVDYASLPALYQSAAFALGVFGTSEKAARVIPNKVYQALATGTAVVTADTPAARELLAHEQNALLVPAGDPDALVEALRRLVDDETRRDELAARGHETYEANASEEVLGRRWRSLLERVTS